MPVGMEPLGQLPALADSINDLPALNTAKSDLIRLEGIQPEPKLTTPLSQTRPKRIQKKTARRYDEKMISIECGHLVF